MQRASILALVLALGLSVGAAVGPSISSASAQSSQVSTETVAAMLTGFEHTPGIAEWQALGPSVIPALASIAGDAQQPGFVRLRAIQAAGSFSTPAARAMLRRGLRSREPLVVREAAIALARAFGESALRDVAPLLTHPDTAVREGVIRAIGGMQSPAGGPSEAAMACLRARLPRESDEVLRAQIERALGGTVGGSGSTPG